MLQAILAELAVVVARSWGGNGLGALLDQCHRCLKPLGCWDASANRAIVKM